MERTSSQLWISIGFLLFLVGCSWFSADVSQEELLYSAVPVIPEHVYVGDLVYVNDSYAYVGASPHEVKGRGSQVVFELVNHEGDGNKTIAFGFKKGYVKPTQLERWNPRDVVERKEYACLHEFNYTQNPNYFWCYWNSTYTNQIEIVYEHNFTGGSVASGTAWWNETVRKNWSVVKPGVLDKISYDYDGKDTWYYKQDYFMLQEVPYKFRVTFHAPIIPIKGRVKELYPDYDPKYDVVIWNSSYGLDFLSAMSDGAFIVLDPTFVLSDNLMFAYDADGASCTEDRTTNNWDLQSNGASNCTGVRSLPGNGSAFRIQADRTKNWNATITGLPSGSANRTMCMWINVSSYMSSASTAGWVGWGSSTSCQAYYMGESNNGVSAWRKNLYAHAVCDINIEVNGASSGGLNVWQHYCFAWDGAKNWGWKNGVNTLNNSNAMNTASVSKFWIGNSSLNTNPGNVIIDNIYVWDRFLNYTEIPQVYSCGSYDNCFVTNGVVNVTWESPTADANHENASGVYYTVNVSCSGGDCGDVFAYLDPEMFT